MEVVSVVSSGTDQLEFLRSRAARWGVACIALLLTVSIVAVSLALHYQRQRRDAELRALVQARFSQLSRRIPNLRVFPGWGNADNAALRLTQCSVESTAFRGKASRPRISSLIANPYREATKPDFQVCLYDLDGRLLGATKPAEFWYADFQPGESKYMPESFKPLAKEPMFYSVVEFRDGKPVAAPLPVSTGASAQARDPKKAQEYYARGQKELKAGNLEMAAFYFEQARIADPANAEIGQALNLAQRKLGRHTPDADGPAEAGADATPVERLRRYFYDNFGGSGDPKYATSWYDNIRRFELRVPKDGSYAVTIYTNIYKDSDADAPAASMARATYGFSRRVSSVTVIGTRNGHEAVLLHQW